MMKNIQTGALLALLTLAFASSCKSGIDDLIINPCGIDFETTLHYVCIADDFGKGTANSHPDSTLGYFFNDTFVHGTEAISEYQEYYVDGATSAEMAEEIAGLDLSCSNLITVYVGSNDVLQSSTGEDFRSGYRAILSQCVNITSDPTRVTGMLIPDFSGLEGLPEGQVPSDVSTRIGLFNSIITEESANFSINLANANGLTEAIYNAGLGTDEASEGGDDFHPSSLTVKAWASTMAGVASDAIPLGG